MELEAKEQQSTTLPSTNSELAPEIGLSPFATFFAG